MKYKKTIMLGIIVLTIVMISGVTFALWQITLRQESTNVITTGCFRVEFQDENPISLSNAFPITDEEGRVLIPYTFTITNTCDSYASYQINLEILNDTTLENLDYLKIMVEDNIDLLNKKETVSKTLENATTSKKLETGYLDINGSKTYHLRLWMSENTPNDESFMNKIFNSKVTIIATYQTEFDKESPISTIEVTNLSNQIKVDASSSSDNTNIKYYYYSLDGESFVKTSEPEYTFEVGALEYGVATETIKTLADSLEDEYTIYVKTEDEYGNVSEVVSKKVYKDFAYDETIDNNLRYIGASPNNYVSFNNELWRVIGVMENIDDGTGLKETRIKIIRDESIGNYSWDSSISTVNGGHGVNEWSQADAMKLMNPGYESESIGGSLYWNATSGKCYINYLNQTSNCDFSKNGLSFEAKDYIENALWNTGSIGTTSYNVILANNFYSLERGNYTGKYCTSADSGYCTDNVTRTTTWVGKIGLMYPSDYGYATSGGNITSRKKCLNTALVNWGDSNINDCKENNWLYNPNVSVDWTLTTSGSTVKPFGIVRRFQDGSISGNENAFDLSAIHPVFYLRSNTKIANGIGTKEQPFELSLN